MTGFRLSPHAVRDLEEIDANVASHDPAAAVRTIERLLTVAQLIGTNPAIGVAR
jgi:plasmid stabilization system protein ParE